MREQYPKEKYPRIVELKGLRELREVREYDPWSVANKVSTQRNWFWRLLNWISGRADLAKTVIRLREQVINMETVRMAGLRESDQAGALGLQLYAENETLRKQVEDLTNLLDNPIKYEETVAFFRDQRDTAVRESEILKWAYERLLKTHNRLLDDWEIYTTKFIDGDPDLADVFRKIDKLKEEQ